MQTSPSGRKFIEQFEGLSLQTYNDGTGVLTIGYGHTSAAGFPNVIRGMKITQTDADDILATDLGIVEEQVNVLVANKAKVTLSQPQFDALVSFQFNTGWLAHPQCSLLKALLSGNFDLAERDFMLYDEAGGRTLPGLVKRRAAERLLFTTGNYGGASNV